MIEIILAYFLTAQLAASATERSCDLADFAPLCSSLPDGKDVPFPKSLTDAQAEAKVKKTFAWVKEQMKKEILAGASAPQNPVQRSWYQRIETLEMDLNKCGPGTPMGRYSSVSHRIQICPEVGRESDGRLIWLLAHEAAHAIDGCSGQRPLYKRNSDLPKLVGPKLGRDTNMAIGEVNGSQYFVEDFRSFLSRPEDISSNLEEWEAKGIITRLDGGISANEFPLAPVLNCLAQEKFITEDAAVVRAGVACRQGSVSETPSDIWAARIAGLYLKKNPLKDDYERLTSLSRNGVKLLCGKQNRFSIDSPRWNNSKDDRYINDRWRDTATFLSDPDVQAALGCKPLADRGKCMQKFSPAMKALAAKKGDAIKANPVDTSDVNR